MKLAELPRLIHLSLSDPHWGDSPIACLCNYQTYVLFTLPNLKYLDTMLLAEETKQLAEATYVKKKLYYNMRTKTMRRNVKQVITQATKGKEVFLALIYPSLVVAFKKTIIRITSTENTLKSCLGTSRLMRLLSVTAFANLSVDRNKS